MIFKQPKPVDRGQALLDKAMKSDDYALRDRATQYVIDELSEKIETQEQLEQILAQIPDAEQRYLVLDRLTPMLKFKPTGLVEELQ